MAASERKTLCEPSREEGAEGAAEDAAEVAPTIMSEITTLAKLALPICLASVLSFLMQIVDIVMVGRLGKQELAAASLGTTMFMLVNHPINGALVGLDTMFSQSRGAKRLQEYGHWLVVGLGVTQPICIPFAIFLMFSGRILAVVGIPESLAEMVGVYCTRLVPGIFPLYAFTCLTKYLQCQNILAVSVWIGIAANILNALLNYLLIFHFELGFNAAPVATSLSRWLQLLMLLLYIVCHKTRLSDTWPRALPPRAQALALTKRFLVIALPGAIMLGLEAWAFETTTLMAAYLTMEALDAHTVMLNMTGLLFLTMPFPLGVATSIRTGFLCGCRDPARVQMAAKAALLLMAGCCCLNVSFFFATRSFISYLFIADLRVNARVVAIVPIVAAFQVPDGLQTAIGGIFRGLGQQKLVAFLNFIGFWLVGAPVGYALCFHADLGVGGLWWGITIGLGCTSLLAMAMMSRLNWQEYVGKAADAHGAKASIPTVGAPETLLPVASV